MVNQLPAQPACKAGSYLTACTAILAGDRNGTHGCNGLWIHIHSFSSVGFPETETHMGYSFDVPLLRPCILHTRAPEGSQRGFKGCAQLAGVRQKGEHLPQGHATVPLLA